MPQCSHPYQGVQSHFNERNNCCLCGWCLEWVSSSNRITVATPATAKGKIEKLYVCKAFQWWGQTFREDGKHVALLSLTTSLHHENVRFEMCWTWVLVHVHNVVLERIYDPTITLCAHFMTERNVNCASHMSTTWSSISLLFCLFPFTFCVLVSDVVCSSDPQFS